MIGVGYFSKIADWLADTSIIYLPPIPSVAIVIVEHSRVLLIDRADGYGLCLPGGIMHWGESTHDAVKREVLEETGLTIEVSDLIGVYSGRLRDERASTVCSVYRGKITNGVPTGKDEGKPLWIRTEEIAFHRLAFDTFEIIADYLNQQQMSSKAETLQKARGI